MIKTKNILISNSSKTFIIAEACENHLGSMKKAFKMIDMSKECGVDAVKFQHHIPDDEMLKKVPKSKNFREDLYMFLKKNSLKINQHIELKKYCDKKKIIYLCTPFSYSAAAEINSLVPLFKIGSGELLDHPTLLKISKFNKPMILSTGMSKEKEIFETYNILKKKSQLILMHCLSEYPPIYEDLNIGYIKIMKKKFPKAIIGYSDHTNEIYSSLVAVSYGAKVIEKHVTLDQSVECPDKDVSINFDQLYELVSAIRKIEKSLGEQKKIHNLEKPIREWAHRSIVSIKEIKKNDFFTNKNISTKRPGIGIPARELKKVLGKRAKKFIKSDQLINRSDIKK